MPIFNLKIIGADKLISAAKHSNLTIYKALDHGIRKSALIITDEVKKVTPKKTGALASSIRPTFGFLKATIKPGMPYAYYVHQGTKPHEIRPKLKKALSWKGALHPVRKVSHPGTKGIPYLEIGLERSKQKVDKIFQQEITNMLKTFE